MKSTQGMLMEVLEDGKKLSLMDGSIWFINPYDMPTVCTWIPTTSIKITLTNKDDSFPYELINESIGVIVKARKEN